MGIGARISAWLNNTPPFREIIQWNDDIKIRSNTMKEFIRNNGVFDSLWSVINIATAMFAFVGYVVMGMGEPDNYFLDNTDNKVIDSISKEIGDLAREALTAPETKELIEVMGSLISDPVIGFLKSYADKGDINNDEFLRGFYGTLMLPSLIGSLVNSAGEVLSAGQLDSLGAIVKDSYFTLGLGFIGWQGISPLLSESVLPAVTRDAKRTYRPARFKENDIITLYRYRRLDINQAIELLRFEGWRDSDLDNVLFLAQEHLNRGDILAMLESGVINRLEAQRRLLNLGYTPSDINDLLLLEEKRKTDQPKQVSLTTARKALKLGIIEPSQFADYLRALGYTEANIQLEISIIDFDKEVEQKELSISQLKSAYMNNVITNLEVAGALRDLDYSTDAIQTIVETWRKEKLPKVLRINKTTILQALTKGVISADSAYTKLRELGYPDNDAKLMIETVTVQTGVNVKTVSDGKILQAYQTGIIQPTDARNRLVQRGYSEGDADLLLRLADSQSRIELSQDDILDAYLYGAIDRNRAVSELQNIGATQSFIDTRLATMDKRRVTSKALPSAKDISSWLRGGIISESQARLKLQEVGFSGEDSSLFIQAVSVAPSRDLSDSNIADALTVGVIGTDKALELFKSIGLDQNEAQLRVDTIIKEKEIFRPRATPAVLVSAARDGIITPDDLESKLREFGLTDDSIQLYLQMATLEGTAKKIMLSKSDILKAYRRGFIIEAEAISLLEAKEYSLEEAALLLAMEKVEITSTEVYQALVGGFITVGDAVSAFSELGYSDDEIAEVLSDLGLEI